MILEPASVVILRSLGKQNISVPEKYLEAGNLHKFHRALREEDPKKVRKFFRDYYRKGPWMPNREKLADNLSDILLGRRFAPERTYKGKDLQEEVGPIGDSLGIEYDGIETTNDFYTVGGETAKKFEGEVEMARNQAFERHLKNGSFRYSHELVEQPIQCANHVVQQDSTNVEAQERIAQGGIAQERPELLREESYWNGMHCSLGHMAHVSWLWATGGAYHTLAEDYEQPRKVESKDPFKALFKIVGKGLWPVGVDEEKRFVVWHPPVASGTS